MGRRRASLLERGPDEVCLAALFRKSNNNVTEYEALLHGLRFAVALGVQRLVILGDSKLVVNHVMKDSECKDPKMEAYCTKIRKLKSRFDGIELCHIPRRDNDDADHSLARLGSKR